MANEVRIIKSETWLENADTEVPQRILSEAIFEHVLDDDTIINIQVISRRGLNQFWIFAQFA